VFKVVDLDQLAEIARLSTFDNPEYRQVERRLAKAAPGSQMKRKLEYRLGHTEKQIKLARPTVDMSSQRMTLEVPRGLRAVAGAPAPKLGERSLPEAVDLPALRGYQVGAVENLSRMPEGILHAPTGAGKTTMAKHLIDRSGLPTLIVVPTLALLDQWVAELRRHWPEDVGRIGGGKSSVASLTVASIATLAKMDAVGLFVDWPPGSLNLILDECHHAMASTWRRVLERYENKAAHVWGLTATPWRNGMDRRCLEVLIGPVIEVPRDDVLDAGGICRFDVIRIDTGFQGTVDPSEEHAKALAELIRDQGRLRSLVNATWQLALPGGITMILTDRVEHADAIRATKAGAGLLTGSMNAKLRAAELQVGIQSGIIVATSGILSEGFDLPAASTLVLASPMRFDGALIQKVGRVLRPAEGKSMARVIDLVDSDPLWLSQWRSRAKVYRELGAEVKTYRV